MKQVAVSLVVERNGEGDCGPDVVLGLERDLAIQRLNQLLADCESDPASIWVDAWVLRKHPEQPEQFGLVFVFDSDSSVLDFKLDVLLEVDSDDGERDLD